MLDVEIAGPTPGSGHDQLAVTATLGGTLCVRFLDGFVPQAGDRFVVVAAAVVDAFAALDLPPGVTATVETTATTAELVIGMVTDAEPTGDLPVALALPAPMPNPARGATTIHYELAEAERVRLDVYDLLGRRVAALADGRVETGSHTVRWRTRELAGGVYIVRLRAGGVLQTQRVTVIR